MNRTIALIPLRKGSQRIKDKARQKIDNKELWEYTVIRALNELGSNSVFITTDYEENIFKKYNVNYIRRPDKLCTNEALATGYIYHAIDELTLNLEDTIVLLQPTCPIRTQRDIGNAINTFRESGKNSLVSCQKYKDIGLFYDSNYKSLTGNTLYTGKREVYKRNSSIYIFKVELFLDTESIFEVEPAIYEQKDYCCLDINYPDDLKMVKILIEGGILNE